MWTEFVWTDRRKPRKSSVIALKIPYKMRTAQLQNESQNSQHLSTFSGQWVLGNIIVAKLVKKLPASHSSRRFTTVCTKVCHWTLFWGSFIHSIIPHPILLRVISISSFCLALNLPGAAFPREFPTKLMYFNFSHAYMFCPLYMPLSNPITKE
jgi:hypothetical protein